MPSESQSRLPRFSKIEKAESNEQPKALLKNLVFRQIDTISLQQAKILLGDIRILERFLFSAEYPKERHRSGKNKSEYIRAYENAYNRIWGARKKMNTLEISPNLQKDYFVKGLKDVVGGMINAMPSKKVQEILTEPSELISIITGKPFIIPVTQKIFKPVRIVFKREAKKEENGEKKEKDPILAQIIQITETTWASFPWEDPEALLHSVRENFKSNGLDVKVEFFRPNDKSKTHNKEDYIVIAENIPEKERGIVVPRQGVVLDVEMTADLFLGPKPGREVSPASLSVFPEVQREFKDAKFVDTYWKVTNYGQLRKSE